MEAHVAQTSPGRKFLFKGKTHPAEQVRNRASCSPQELVVLTVSSSHRPTHRSVGGTSLEASPVDLAPCNSQAAPGD